MNVDLHKAAKHASLVYASENQCQAKCKEWGMQDFSFHDDGTAQGYVAGNDFQIVIVFRGTEPNHLMDIVADLKVKKTKAHGGGKVHSGFLDYMSGIGNAMHENARDLHTQGNPGKQIRIYGHSLGAAASVVYADRFHLAEPTLVLFGCPNTGNKKFAKQFNKRFGNHTHRVVNNNDIVTRIPVALPTFIYRALRLIYPSWPLIPGGYRPVGLHEHYFDYSGRQHHNPDWKFRLCDRIGGRLEDFGKLGTDGVKDHSMSNYLDLTKPKETA